MKIAPAGASPRFHILQSPKAIRLCPWFSIRTSLRRSACREYVVDPFEFSRLERQVRQAADAFVDLFRLARADQYRGQPFVLEQPRERHLREALTTRFRNI